jgi:hypothetical protein
MMSYPGCYPAGSDFGSNVNRVSTLGVNRTLIVSIHEVVEISASK